MTGRPTRLIVVLGFSDGDRDELHPICAQRLAHAAQITTERDVVVFSGWARTPGTRPEAELMAEAWTGRAREVVLDPDARTTVANAANVVDDVRRAGATEVVIVTSRWHARRALTVFRWKLRGLGAAIVGSSPPHGGPRRQRLGELWRWAALPLQLTFGDDPEVLRLFDQWIEPVALLKRASMLLLGAVSLYLLAPTLLEVLSSWDTLGDLRPGWLLLIGMLQVLVLACLWAVQRLALGNCPWPLIISSQLTANAASRLIPGGAATGTAVHFRLLRAGGVSASAAGLGLAVASLLQVAITLALPAIALPAVTFGAPVPEGLGRVAWAGGGLFALLVILATATLADDRLLRAIGRLVDWVRSLRSRRSGGTDPKPATGPGLLDRRDEVVVGLDGDWGKAVGFSAARSTLDYLSLVAAIAAVGANGRLSLVLLAFASATLLGLIPFTPGGLGFVEAGLTGTLALAGIDTTDAIGIALVYRLFSFWLPIPAGLVAGLYHRQRYRPA